MAIPAKSFERDGKIVLVLQMLRSSALMCMQKKHRIEQSQSEEHTVDKRLGATEAINSLLRRRMNKRRQKVNNPLAREYLESKSLARSEFK